jgi:succinate dehydrogenase/fumarate reductase flavoprotein subunit
MMTDIEADVAIVGFGGAGAVAAIEAHDAGASVVVLEKMETGGGTTQESSGNIRVIADHRKAAHHYRNLTLGTTPLAVMEVFTHGVSEIPSWIEKLGGEIHQTAADPIKYIFPYIAPTTSYPDYEGADGIGGRWAVKPQGDEGGGAALWHVLAKNVEQRNIKVVYRAPASRLIKEEGRIVGVTALMHDGELTVRTNRAVVLASGGFAYNAEMQKQFIGYELAAFSPPGRNTGDGIVRDHPSRGEGCAGVARRRPGYPRPSAPSASCRPGDPPPRPSPLPLLPPVSPTGRGAAQRCASDPKEIEKWPPSVTSTAASPTRSSPIWSRASGRG